HPRLLHGGAGVDERRFEELGDALRPHPYVDMNDKHGHILLHRVPTGPPWLAGPGSIIDNQFRLFPGRMKGWAAVRRILILLVATALAGSVVSPARASVAATSTSLQVYGAWHCSNDACLWGSVRDMTDFDRNNHWLIDRGDGRPSVNLVILSFVNPLRLLNRTTDAQTLSGVPRGMTAGVVGYFTSHG